MSGANQSCDFGAMKASPRAASRLSCERSMSLSVRLRTSFAAQGVHNVGMQYEYTSRIELDAPIDVNDAKQLVAWCAYLEVDREGLLALIDALGPYAAPQCLLPLAVGRITH